MQPSKPINEQPFSLKKIGKKEIQSPAQGLAYLGYLVWVWGFSEESLSKREGKVRKCEPWPVIRLDCQDLKSLFLSLTWVSV